MYGENFFINAERFTFLIFSLQCFILCLQRHSLLRSCGRQPLPLVGYQRLKRYQAILDTRKMGG
jgi:hypothetical protein